VLDVLEGEDVGTEFCLRDTRRGLVGMVRQVADGPDIHLLGSFGQPAELQVFEPPLAQ
jgi:hypothetical protein